MMKEYQKPILEITRLTPEERLACVSGESSTISISSNLVSNFGGRFGGNFGGHHSGGNSGRHGH